MATVRVRGVDLEIKEAGVGDSLVLVHGSVSDYRTWADQQAMLSAQFRTIAYSRRYHWPNQSIAPGADYAIQEHVEDLEALLPEIAQNPVHLVAHSYGAFVALLLAIRNPAQIRSLVLAEPPVLPLFVSIPPKPHEMLALLFRRPRLAAAVYHIGARGFGPATAAFKRGDREAGLDAFGRAVLGNEAFEKLSPERLQQVHDNLIVAEFLGSGYPPVDDGAVRRVTTPTLLVGASDSPSIFGFILDRLEELMPHTERAEIPRASHIMYEDNPQAFHDSVSRFLDGH